MSPVTDLHTTGPGYVLLATGIDPLSMLKAQHGLPKPVQPCSRYHVMKHNIAEGSTSVVDLAEDSITGVKVALKHVLKTPVYLHSIEMERTIHRNLSHPNLMSVIDMYEDQRQITLVLPYMAGGDLLDSIPADVGLDPSMVLSYAKQLLSAISHLHDNGFAHRDIKPDNCLVSDDKQTIYLCDFGNAAITSDESTYGHRRCGTISYMAPELLIAGRVLRGADFLKADMWAVGVLIFAMLTGRFPWSRADLSNTTYTLYMQGRHRGAEAQRWASFPEYMRRLLYKLLAVDPKKRPTANEVLEMLNSVAE